MNVTIKEKMLAVCKQKIEQKGEGVQVSFYAFFANRNDDPETLMDVARWWIEEHKLNHFEKATKIYAMVKALETQSVSDQLHSNEVGLSHITLSVSDLDKSLAFYQDVLGFEGEVRWNQGAYLSYGSCWLCLLLGHAAPSQDYSHVAFRFDRQKMQSIQQRSAYKKVIEWQSNNSEGHSLYIKDPDGHKLELHSGTLITRLMSLKNKPYEGLIWLK